MLLSLQLSKTHLYTPTPYYSAKYSNICYHCGIENVVDNTNYYPICVICSGSNKGKVKRGMKRGDRRTALTRGTNRSGQVNQKGGNDVPTSKYHSMVYFSYRLPELLVGG